MTDADRTRQQLEGELAELRRRVTELEAQVARHRQAETETTRAHGWEQALAEGQLAGSVHVAHDITERNQAEPALARHAQELEALYTTSLEINAQRSLPTLLRAIVERAATLLNARMGGLYLLKPDGETLELAVSLHLPGDYVGTRLRLGEGLSGRVAQTGQPIMIADYKAWEGRAAPYADSPFRRVLGVPLKIGQRILGVINVTDDKQAGTFSEDEIKLVSLFADQAAIAVENARLFDEARHHAEQMATVNRIGLAIASGSDMDHVLWALYEQCSQVVSIDQFYVAVYDREADLIHFPLFCDRDGYRAVEPEDMRTQPGITGYVVKTRQTLYVPDLTQLDPSSPAYLLPTESKRSRSYLGVPLTLHDQVVGAISVQSYQPDAYGADEIRLLEIISTQAAIAIENARLYEQAVRAGERRATLYRATQEISASVDREQICLTVHKAVMQVMPVDAVVIALLDKEQQEIELVYLYDAGQRWPDQRVPLGQGLTSYIITTGKSLRVDNILSEAAKQVTGAIQFGVTDLAPLAVIAAPLKSGNTVTGMLSVQSHAPTRYTDEDLELLEMLAAHVTTAFENARLFNEMRRRDVIMAALAYIQEKLLMSDDPATVMLDVLEHLGRSIRVSHTYIFENHTSDDDMLITSRRFEWTAPDSKPQIDNAALQEFSYAGCGLDRWVEMLGANHLIFALVRDLPAPEHALWEAHGIRSIAIAPIFSGDEWWGFLGLDDCERARVWSAAEMEALRSAASALGAAIDRQHSEAAERDQRVLAEALRDTASALNKTLNTNQVLDLILAHVGRVVPHDAAGIFLLDGQRNIASIWRYQDYLEPQRVAQAGSARFTIAETRNLSEMMETGEPIVVPDTRVFPGWVNRPGWEWVCSHAGMPIRVQGRVIGFLNLYSATPNFFFSAHAERLQAFADQAAIAIENARLYAETRQHAANLTLLYGITQVAGRSLALDQVLSQALEAALTLLDFEAGLICLADLNDWNDLRRAAVRGLPLAVSELIEPDVPEDLLCAYVHRQQASLVLHPLQQRVPEEISTVSTQLADLGWRACAGIPLLHQEQSLGVMCLLTRQPPPPSSYDLALLTTMGRQMATAIANAQLFQATLSERSRLQALIESSRDGIILNSLDERILVINARALKMLRLPGQPADWLGRHVRDMLTILRHASAEMARILVAELRHIQTGDEPPSEGEVEAPPFMIHWLNLPVLVGQAPLGRLVILRDVTDERAVERLRDDMTHMMVHDLRNPLASTLTSVEIMLLEAADTHLSGDMLEALRIAHAQALKMQTLVNRILEILQFERGQMPLNCAPIALGELIAETLRLQSPLAEARGIRLESDVPAALPAAWADAELIGRVLQNLVGNAIKFTPKGGSVRVRLQREGDEQPKFLVSVSDTGPGIPAEIQGRLFQKFVRGRQEGRGTGLGLAFCKLVLEAHREHIWVQSTSAQGTTIAFSLSLPLNE